MNSWNKTRAQRPILEAGSKLHLDQALVTDPNHITPCRSTNESYLCNGQADSTTETSPGSPFEIINSMSVSEELEANGAFPGITSLPSEHAGKLHDQVTNNAYGISHVLGERLSCSTLMRLKGLVGADTLEDWQSLDGFSLLTIRSSDETTHEVTSSPADLLLCYVLSNPSRLLRSFRDDVWPDHHDSKLPHLDPVKLEHAFRGWSEVNGPLIFDSLWKSLESLFRPPLRASHLEGLNGLEDPYLSDAEAAHIVMLCIHALTSHVPRAIASVWPLLRRQPDTNFLSTKQARNLPKHCKKSLLQLYDALHYEPALRLAERLLRAIAARRYHHECRQSTRSSGNEHLGSVPFGLMQIVCQHLTAVENQARQQREAKGIDPQLEKDTGWTVTSCFLEWLRTVFLTSWDKKATVERWSTVGAAIEIMGDFGELFCW